MRGKPGADIEMRVQEGPFPLNRVIEKLATSDKVTLTAERLPEGEMRVRSNRWDGERAFAAIRCSKSTTSTPDRMLQGRRSGPPRKALSAG
jgi:hypothetical protein